MGGPGACRGSWLLCWGWLLAAAHLLRVEAGCGQRGSPRCCPGRNNTCADLSGSGAPCYCDAYCEKTGDCCADYPGVCQRAAVAKILPDSFKRDFKDPWRRPHKLAKEKQPSYCVYFRLKQVGAACHLHLWSSQLQKERQVCVECRRDAVGSKDRCEGMG